MNVKRGAAPDPGLVLYLPLEDLDGGSLMSRDACGHLCTASGASWHAGGRLFDGIDDYILTPASPAFDIRTSLTLIAWVRSDDVALQQVIVQRGSPTARRYFMDFYLANARIGVANANSMGGGDILTGTGVLAAGRFYQVCGTFDGAALRIYVDGMQDGLKAKTTLPNSDSQAVYTGRMAEGGTYFKGTIGEVRILNRALTPQEIRRIYNSTKWRYQ